MALSTPITLHSVEFAWPDGTVALTGLEGTFPNGASGLVGANGSGKSTLLKLIAGRLTPTSGKIGLSGEVAYLPQDITLHSGATVADLMGVSHTLASLRAIESGSVDPADFDTVGNDWDLEARIQAELGSAGLAQIDLERRVDELSGGETMLLAVLGLRLSARPITLLDEPTNNLDTPTRNRLYGLLDSWPGTLVVVSHDHHLLERMEHTVELYNGSLRFFSGPYSLYRAQLAEEQQAAEQAVRTAGSALKVERRQRVEAETKLARARRKGRAEQLGGNMPRILANSLKQKSETTAGKMRAQLDGKVDAARAGLNEAQARVREVEHINLELADPELPAGRRVAELRGVHGTHILQGPERVGLTGPNGAGKTTLLRHLLDEEVEALPGGTTFTHRVGYLPQRLLGLDDGLTPLENIQAAVPLAAPGRVRNLLARLLLRGPQIDRPLATLSGGERFRVHLACLLATDPPAHLLILDEPTNNLDVDSVRQLAEALNSYRGALLVVSHDPDFLDQLGLDYRLVLGADGSLCRAA